MEPVYVKKYWKNDGIEVAGHYRGQKVARRVRKDKTDYRARRMGAFALFVWIVCAGGLGLHSVNDKTTVEIPKAEASEVAPSPLTVEQGFESADMPRDTISRDGRDYAFDELMQKESGYEAGRLNPKSLACGVGQAYPCTKLYPYATRSWILKNKIVKDGKWYLPNPDRAYEIEWAKKYIANRYGTAQKALDFWNSQYPHWY